MDISVFGAYKRVKRWLYDCFAGLSILLFIFFFFQAEDGIRDIGVTGVQTCALPISVSWSFARELLVTGLDEPAGIGDVRVWPWATPRGDFVALALSSPDGNALFEVPRSVLVRFLRRTYVVVPRGRESEHLDVDAAVNRLLGGR